MPRHVKIWFRVVSSAGRATRLHRVGRGFEPLTTHHFPPVSSHHQAVTSDGTPLPCLGPVRFPTGVGFNRDLLRQRSASGVGFFAIMANGKRAACSRQFYNGVIN